MKQRSEPVLEDYKWILNINFILIVFIETMNSMTSEMIKSSVSPLADSIGISGFVIGLSASLYTFSTICARPLSGYGMDKWKKRNMIIGAFLLKAIVAVLYAFTGSVFVYAISRCVHGFVIGLLGSALPAAIASEVDKRHLGTALGIFATMPDILGASWGTKIAVLLYESMGFRSAYLIIAVFTIIPAFFALFIKFQHDDVLEILKEKRRKFNIFEGISLKAFPLCIMTFFIMVGFFANSLYRLLYMQEKGIDVATAMAVAGMLGSFTGIVGGIISDRFGAKWVVIPSFMMCATAEFLLPESDTYTTCLISCILWTFGIGMYLPALQSQVFNSVSEEKRGAASATWFLCMDLTGFICSPILGWICDWAGYRTCFWFAGIIICFGLIYYIIIGQNMMNKALKETVL